MPLVVNIACINIHLFAAVDKRMCSLETIVCLCLAPSQASCLRSPARGPQRDQGCVMVALLPSPPCIPSSSTAYFFCISSLLKALSPFRAELPSERGTRLRRLVQDPVCAPCRVLCASSSSAPGLRNTCECPCTGSSNVCLFASVANGQHTCGMSAISVLE